MYQICALGADAGEGQQHFALECQAGIEWGLVHGAKISRSKQAFCSVPHDAPPLETSGYPAACGSKACPSFIRHLPIANRYEQSGIDSRSKLLFPL
jgi:hypothetical protein